MDAFHTSAVSVLLLCQVCSRPAFLSLCPHCSTRFSVFSFCLCLFAYFSTSFMLIFSSSLYHPLLISLHRFISHNSCPFPVSLTRVTLLLSKVITFVCALRGLSCRGQTVALADKMLISPGHTVDPFLHLWPMPSHNAQDLHSFGEV